MKPTLRTTLTILALLSSVAMKAQSFVELARISHSTTSSNVDPNNIQGIFNETAVDVLLPLKLNDRIAPLTGFYGERFTFRSSSVDSNVAMHTALLKIGVNVNHSEQFSATYMFLPKISSDFENLDQNHFQLGGLILCKRVFSENFTLKFGAYANKDLFGPLVVPILGMYAQRGRWMINAALPINAEVAYSIMQDKFQAGLQFDGINRSYYSNQRLPKYMEKLNNEIGLFAQYQVQNIYFRLFGGMAVGRRCRFYNQGDETDFAMPLTKFGDDRKTKSEDELDGAMIRLNIIYRLPIN